MFVRMLTVMYSVIPIMAVAGTNTNVVISGDPKLVGPAVHSAAVRARGLGKSYMDRLLSIDNVYGKGGNHGLTWVNAIGRMSRTMTE